MPTAYTYPGVYIKEATGIGSIVGVSTSDTVFIDFFAQGPVGVATEITSMDAFNRTFGGLDQRSEASYAIQQFFLNGGTTAWVVRVIDTTSASPSATAAYNIPFGTGTGAPSLTAQASSPGAWGNQIQIAFDTKFPGTASSTPTSFNMVVRQVATQNGKLMLVAREVYRGLVTDPANPQYVVSVVNNFSSLITLSGGPLTASLVPAPSVTSADVITTTTGPTLPQGVTVTWVTSTTTGADGMAPNTTGSTWAASVGATTLQSGFAALDRMAPNTFSLMCIPAAAELSTTAEMATVYAMALQYCQTYMAFLLIDVPRLYADAATFMSKWYTDSSIENLFPQGDHAAVYFPRLQLPDPLNSYNMRPVAASGTVAGIYANTDANRGVWKAPAGTEAGLVNATVDVNPATNLPVNLNDSDDGELNPFGINAIRNFAIYGTVVWGARTLNGADAMASQWKYIPVRRVALYIEQSLFQASKWIVFEPNDEPLWSEIRKTFTAFMQSLFLQGAFQGSSPTDAYFVRCDSSTTTQDDINGGIVNILVGFAPLKPAEFVVITIQQMAGQAGA
jgi:uncharacterized protein